MTFLAEKIGFLDNYLHGSFRYEPAQIGRSLAMEVLDPYVQSKSVFLDPPSELKFFKKQGI